MCRDRYGVVLLGHQNGSRKATAGNMNNTPVPQCSCTRYSASLAIQNSQRSRNILLQLLAGPCSIRVAPNDLWADR